mgnify:CR=1 FL=1
MCMDTSGSKICEKQTQMLLKARHCITCHAEDSYTCSGHIMQSTPVSNKRECEHMEAIVQMVDKG